MLKLVVALQPEAKPIVEKFKLSRSDLYHPFPAFISDDIAMVISGMGKLNAAAACSALLSKTERSVDELVANIGICAAPNIYSKGSVVLATQITDSESNNSYYPDLLLSHNFNELGVVTYSKPALAEDPEIQTDKAADMECSGFAACCSRYLQPSRFQVIKVVSDHFTCGELDSPGISSLIDQQLEQIHSYLEAYSELVAQNKPILEEDDKLRLKRLREGLKLTTTQGHQLNEWATGYIVKTGSSLCVLDSFQMLEPESKQQAKEILLEVKDVLQAG